MVEPSAVHDDEGWALLCGRDFIAPLQSAVRVLDPHLDVEVADEAAGAWRLRVVRREEAAPEAPELAIAKFSTGTDFAFSPRAFAPDHPV